MVRHLEALNWLGRGIDMVSLTPFSMEAVKPYIKSHRIIAIQNDKTTHKVIIGQDEYTVPCVVSASPGEAVQANYVTYSSGDEAFEKFESDPGVAGRVAVIPPKTHCLRKSLPSDYQFSFYGVNMETYSASLTEYVDFIDADLLLPEIKKLPQPFSNEPSVVAAYRALFGEFGSHVITSTTLGARCNIITWASNKYPDINQNWRRYVAASVRGLNSQGKFDKTVLEEPYFKIFQTIAQTSFTLLGGEKKLAESIMQGNHNYDNYTQWLGTAEQTPALVSVSVTGLWSVLRDSNNSQLRQSANEIEKAFQAIIENQAKTPVTSLVILEAESGVAELGLLTPGASIGVGGPMPNFDPTTQNVIGLSETRVRVGESGASRKSRIVPFYIVNDGSPIDISVNRDQGYANVNINGVGFSLHVLPTSRLLWD
ncbi:hypothetical protein K435DRAFT_874504 [Dendrothele bispora CBS 962.96]|uniref:MACPF domain-containing protein n=1 Tax=Dendrothele bispora (strain CBS 962.96) TaxID=1314807 RepID=A0A4S8KWH2_DENBC|nr:hypothetical protein K435DRAFT_874504 [Dendrothele bispora CBS 962.96]